MKNISLILIFLSAGYFATCNAQNSNSNNDIETNTTIKKMENTQQLRHLVLFKFKDSASKAEISQIEKAFALLPSKIEQISEFEWGLNISPENLDKGFTHSFLLTFDSEIERDLYLPHPDHKAFVALLEPLLDDVIVIDYFTKTN